MSVLEEAEVWLRRARSNLAIAQAVQAQYPGDYYPVSKEEYTRAMEIAQTVLSWAEEQVFRDRHP